MKYCELQFRLMAAVLIVLLRQGATTVTASGWTHQMPDGNRVMHGEGIDLSSLDSIDIPLEGSPLWLLSETYQNGILWLTALEEGRIQAFKVANGHLEELSKDFGTLPSGMPPVLLKNGTEFKVWSPPKDASPWTHAVPLKGSNGVAYINTGGNLSASQTPSGAVALGLGTSNGKLRIWQPEDHMPHVQIESTSRIQTSIDLKISSTPNRTYTLQVSKDLSTWEPIGDVEMAESSAVPVKLFNPEYLIQSKLFIRVMETQVSNFADIQAIAVSGNASTSTFNVTVSSPDTGCEKYADWWEVLTVGGELLYRRILLHSHVNEQPFRRSGGTVDMTRHKRFIIRAHMNDAGYGGWAMIGNLESGFERCLLPPGFAKELETQEPLPMDCAF